MTPRRTNGSLLGLQVHAFIILWSHIHSLNNSGECISWRTNHPTPPIQTSIQPWRLFSPRSSSRSGSGARMGGVELWCLRSEAMASACTECSAFGLLRGGRVIARNAAFNAADETACLVSFGRGRRDSDMAEIYVKFSM
eukprot:scaffold220784_cov32-Tisochrysis_lutea.AAC.11